MTIDDIKAHTIAFASQMANDGAEPADQLTAVSLLIECTLKSVPEHARAKVGAIYSQTILENI